MTALASPRVLMLLENTPYSRDARVPREAETLVSAGYRVVVICPGEPGHPWRNEEQGVRIYRFPLPPQGEGLLGYLVEYGYAMVIFFALSLLVWWREGFDVIHTHCPPDALAFIAAFYKVFGKRFVYDHHDLSPELYSARYGERASRAVHRTLVALEKLACRLADHVIATNESYKRVEMERGGVPEERVTVVRNGPDLRRLRLAAPASNLCRDGKTCICYVGWMGLQDGVDCLLGALHHLVYDLHKTDFVCVLVGDGEAVPALKSASENLGLKSYVVFAGWVDPGQVARYLTVADICVSPEPSSEYNDRSTAIKVMEYMALGKPVVAFDLPEHRFTAQEAAAYARPNDKLDFARQIAALLDDPERREEMGSRGQERVENSLAWPHQGEMLLAAYESLSSKATTSWARSRPEVGG